MAKNEILNFSGQPAWVRVISIQYFVCKCSFREISMIKIAILDQRKPIFLYFKIKKIQKLKNSKFVNCKFIIHKNGNKTSMQPILKLNSTSFMYYNIFCEMKCIKVIHWGGNGGTVLISSWKCGFIIYLDIQIYYLDIQSITTFLCFLLVLYNLNYSPEKWHFLALKAYSSLSFQPTGIRLDSLWRWNMCVLRIISS